MCVDDIDRRILAELQEDGRLTVTELADRVRLTPAPCHRRLRELERTGVITSYRAVLDPAAVGLGFEAIVSVTLDRGDAGTVAAFEAALAAVPQIRHAERLFGDPDYLLRVVAADLNDYATLRDQKLAALPGADSAPEPTASDRGACDPSVPGQGSACGRQPRPAHTPREADQTPCQATRDDPVPQNNHAVIPAGPFLVYPAPRRCPG